MAPFDLASILGPWGQDAVFLLLGVGFGFSLERGGLGDSRKLAAQFYLTDMRVLRTMFTAIVTAMVLLFLAWGLGWLRMEEVWVNPTHLLHGVLGGLLLGVGFIVGGYCPGTSLVAVATGKLDGLLFALGVVAGTWVFGWTVPLYWESWHHTASLGRLTLYDWLGVPASWVVAAVVVMALGMFTAASYLERWRGELPPPTARVRRGARVGAVALAGAAVLGLVVGSPTLDDQIRRRADELDARLASREVHLSPDEVLELMHSNNVRLELVDVRPRAEYNLFHLLDARPLPSPEATPAWLKGLPEGTVIALVGNGESRAEAAWRRLVVQGALNVYILAGGVNGWLHRWGEPLAARSKPGEDALRYRFSAALGDRHPLARPDPAHVEIRDYEPKVQVRVAEGGGGGCG